MKNVLKFLTIIFVNLFLGIILLLTMAASGDDIAMSELCEIGQGWLVSEIECLERIGEVE